MRSVFMVIVALCLIVASQAIVHANAIYGTGMVIGLTKDSIRINGAMYSLHKKVHVGTYRKTGSKVVEETIPLHSVAQGQEVRYKAYGNMVLELIILKR